MLLMIDNYDSFTYNLVQEMQTISDIEIRVVRNDALSVEELLLEKPEAIVISPGPGEPHEAGITMDLIRAADNLPLLGICLGHQALAAVHGAEIVRAPEPVHGKTSEILHDRSGVFSAMPKPFEATRYHSLVVERESLKSPLEICAWTADGLIMGLKHKERPHFGVQFHPESYLTRNGMHLLARFLEISDLGLKQEWRQLMRKDPNGEGS
jgi:anthranilate synthase/aminodeoxychorismate synthase-like glutamine amidotransferase